MPAEAYTGRGAEPRQPQPSSSSTCSGSGSQAMTAGAKVFRRADASAGLWWPPGMPRAPRSALLNRPFVGFRSQRLFCRRGMLGGLVGRQVPLVGKPSGKASWLRRNPVRPCGDPKLLTSLGVTKCQPAALATENGGSVAKSTGR